jgi:CAAX protease family protein
MLSEKPWRLEKVLFFCATLFLSICLGATSVSLLRQSGVPGFAPNDSGVIIIATLTFQGAACLLIPFFLRVHRVNWREAFGLRGPNLPRACYLAVLTTIVILPAALWLQKVSVDVLTKPGQEPEVQEVVKVIGASRSPWLKAYLGFFALGVAPVAEEFIFRGMLYPLIKRLGFPQLAWLGVSALFALVHVAAATFVPLFVLALALTWLYEKTDNLLAPILTHVLFNTFNYVMLIFAASRSLPPPA